MDTNVEPDPSRYIGCSIRTSVIHEDAVLTEPGRNLTYCGAYCRRSIECRKDEGNLIHSSPPRMLTTDGESIVSHERGSLVW